MRLVSYWRENELRPGVLVKDAVYDIRLLLGLPDSVDRLDAPGLREILSQFGADLLSLSARIDAALSLRANDPAGRIGSLRLGPPIANPAKVLCIGLNYRDHVSETGRALPKFPDVFAKFATTLIGPSDVIDCSKVTHNLDYEGELAVVMGRACRDVNAADALTYVAGVMVLNDITARDLQYRGTQWLPGKAVDGSTPCGPTLVTLDEIENIQDLNLTTRVNGVQVQSSNTRWMIFSVADLVAYISTFLRLEPGDVITTGTPQGIGAKREPPCWLNVGDQVEVEIADVGRLVNVVC